VRAPRRSPAGVGPTAHSLRNRRVPPSPARPGAETEPIPQDLAILVSVAVVFSWRAYEDDPGGRRPSREGVPPHATICLRRSPPSTKTSVGKRPDLDFEHPSALTRSADSRGRCRGPALGGRSASDTSTVDPAMADRDDLRRLIPAAKRSGENPLRLDVGSRDPGGDRVGKDARRGSLIMRSSAPSRPR